MIIFSIWSIIGLVMAILAMITFKPRLDIISLVVIFAFAMYFWPVTGAAILWHQRFKRA